MVAAMNAVKCDEMGMDEAFIAHDVPKTTLKDREGQFCVLLRQP